MPIQMLSPEEITARTATAKSAGGYEKFIVDSVPPVKELKVGAGFYLPIKGSKNPWVNRYIKRWSDENGLTTVLTLHRDKDGGSGYVVRIESLPTEPQAKLKHKAA